MDERSLGDPPAPAEDEPKVTASEYAEGKRPGRARVKIRHNLHLYPRLQELADEIELTPDGEDVDDLIDEYEATRDRMETVYVLERRSPEWRAEVAKQHRKEMGLPKGGAKDIASGKVTYEQMVEFGARLVAEQVVEPAGVTWEALLEMAEAGAVDVDGRAIVDTLAAAAQDLNAGRYEAMTLDFSQRRSMTRRKRRSSTR